MKACFFFPSSNGWSWQGLTFWGGCGPVLLLLVLTGACQIVAQTNDAYPLKSSSGTIAKGVILTFRNVEVEGNIVQGDFVVENISGSSIDYGIFNQRPIFHLKLNETDQVARPQPLRQDIRALWSETSEEYAELRPGDSTSGRFLIKGTADKVWFGFRVGRDPITEEVLWAGPFSSGEVRAIAVISGKSE